jgi:hypothetical protein
VPSAVVRMSGSFTVHMYPTFIPSTVMRSVARHDP